MSQTGGPPQAAHVAALADELVRRRHVPGATYRLQLNHGFTLRDATALVPYLDALGITDCYTSPLLKARAGSTHGYDICDHTQLNPEIGSLEDLARFAAALRARGMGLLLDVVPNHMGIGESSNAWWTDVLENGPSSLYAAYFDIDWQPLKAELHDKVLLPLLEDQYGHVLESGKLRLAYEDGGFFVYYYDHRLPVAPLTWPSVLGYHLRDLVAALGEAHEHVMELQSILTALGHLPPRSERAPERIAERMREKEVIRRRIGTLYHSSPAVRTAVDDAVRAFNGRVGEPSSFDLLDALLDAQAYRLAYWRVAAEEINYRRFFDVNDLAAIRVELPAVFRATHQLILSLLAERHVTGVRIDHPDGLWDPPGYFRELQTSYVLSCVRAHLCGAYPDEEVEAAVASWFATRYADGAKAAPCPLYVVAEKILARGERLPEDWAVDGTTGYDFANAASGLFVDAANRRAVDAIYNSFVGQRIDFRNVVNASKKMIMLVALASEVSVLSHQLNRISERHRWYRDFTVGSLTFALREVIAALPVYRTYVSGDEPGSVSRHDQAYVQAAVAEAKRRNPRTAEALFDFIGDTLLLRTATHFRPEARAELASFVRKVQQVTGPVMAKGVEDTAFYVYNRLVALNEVGGEPDQFGTSVVAFHRQNAERLRRWPHAMLTTATHDTKRGEDVRARIAVLSEMPREWRSALRRWAILNRRKKTLVDGQPAPDRNDEYLLYQTLLGAWPAEALDAAALAAFRARVAAYMEKATREAKVHTSWVNPNEPYDAAVRTFVERLLPDGGEDPFLDDFRPFRRRVAFYGQLNGLVQALLKHTAPGGADTYQGTELWDLSLVDPDNRRPVDYARRAALLADVRARAERDGADLRALAQELLAGSADGWIKLYLVYRALTFRRAHAALFAHGGYQPLEAGGLKREHVVAFARTLDDSRAVVVAPRLVVRLTGGVERPPCGDAVWQDTWLALPHEGVGQAYRDRFTGAVLAVGRDGGAPGLPLAEVCRDFPLALLERMG